MELLRRQQGQFPARPDVVGVAAVAVAFGEVRSCAAADGSSSQSAQLENVGC